MSVDIRTMSSGSVTSHVAEISILFYWILQLYIPDAKVDNSYKDKVQKDRHKRVMHPMGLFKCIVSDLFFYNNQKSATSVFVILPLQF